MTPPECYTGRKFFFNMILFSERSWDDQHVRQGLLEAIREREQARMRLYGGADRGRLSRAEIDGKSDSTQQTRHVDLMLVKVGPASQTMAPTSTQHWGCI